MSSAVSQLFVYPDSKRKKLHSGIVWKIGFGRLFFEGKKAELLGKKMTERPKSEHTFKRLFFYR